MKPEVERVARAIEHTLLSPQATPEQIDRLCDEAMHFGFAGVCVNPLYVRRAAQRIAAACPAGAASHRPVVVSVAGFPLGASRPDTKADEARRALDDGAGEIDMVIALGLLIAGDRRAVRADIEAVARVVHGHSPPGVLKVILETAALSEEQIVLACRACAEGEADFVKTSTGLHPAGGATVKAVRLLVRCASPLRVKASGGIRTAAQAVAMLEAGASRIGTSSGPAIIEELSRGGAS